jgi:hypothetical protein
MKRLLALLCLTGLCLLPAVAQNEPEYRLELGAGAGLTAYTGDFNGNVMRGMQPLGEVVAKYKMNPRMAWGAALGFGQLKGSSTNADTWYPGLAVTPVDFKTSLVDFNVRYEYNFWPFGTGREYYGAKKLTPFIALGLGASIANAKLTQDGIQTKSSSVAGQLPIGLGVKYKMGARLNLAVEWMMHFTAGDKLDGIKDPYGIESSGLFKNTDCYSMLGLTLTYDLWAKCKTCHNDRD